MIKTRIASTAALFTFGLAALGGTVVAIAAPANAETGTTSSSSGSTDTSGNMFKPKEHESFPTKPHSPHEGHGHKGLNEPHGNPPEIWPNLMPTATA